jgi:hypothetical protein
MPGRAKGLLPIRLGAAGSGMTVQDRSHRTRHANAWPADPRRNRLGVVGGRRDRRLRQQQRWGRCCTGRWRSARRCSGSNRTWPTRVAVSGHEMAWDYVDKTVDDQIQVVQDERPEAERFVVASRSPRSIRPTLRMGPESDTQTPPGDVCVSPRCPAAGCAGWLGGCHPCFSPPPAPLKRPTWPSGTTRPPVRRSVHRCPGRSMGGRGHRRARGEGHQAGRGTPPPQTS